MTDTWQKDNFIISTDKNKLQPDEIYTTLSQSYWAVGRTKETIAKSIENSLCFGVYSENKQIGLARVISDYATFAYLCDVYINKEFQGAGLGKWLIATVVGHPQLQGLRRWSLATRDAHGLYRQFGFREIQRPEIWMELFNPHLT